MKKINFAVVGLGVGLLHLDAIVNHKNAQIVAICDTDEELLEKKAAQYDVKFSCSDYKELLSRDDIDAICVATPDYLHEQMVIDFLEAGKHVLCEKPLALTSRECNNIIKASDNSDAILMVGQVCRMTPSFAYAKKLVDDGVIGELFFVESEYAHDYSHMGKCWRNDHSKPRHPYIGGGCHAVDLLRWIAGDPIQAYGISNKKVLTDWPCDDSVISVFKFPNGVMGKVFVSTGCKRNYTMRTVLYGTKGTIITDNTSSYVSLFKEEIGGEKEMYERTTENVEMRLSIAINNHNILGEVDEFCKVISGEQELKLTAREGAATVAVCEAVVQSTQTGLPQVVNYPAGFV